MSQELLEGGSLLNSSQQPWGGGLGGGAVRIDVPIVNQKAGSER